VAVERRLGRWSRVDRERVQYERVIETDKETEKERETERERDGEHATECPRVSVHEFAGARREERRKKKKD